MKRCVVDASVIAAAFFQEKYASAARDVLSGGRALLAPDLVQPEFANVVWKRYRRREIDAGEAADLLADFLSLPLHITASQALLEPAMQIALHTGRTVYDCLYLALAIERRCAVCTADQRLVNALADTPLAEHLTLLH